MKEGPLNEKELEWLEEVLVKYGNDDSVLDVAELDGFLTAILSGPRMIEPSEWLVALWGGAENIPKWASERELNRFMDLTFQHMNDISDRLIDYPDQFEPLFGVHTIDDAICAVSIWMTGLRYLNRLRLLSTPSLYMVAMKTKRDWKQCRMKTLKKISRTSFLPRLLCTIIG
jgi:uncharacterized protein YecA (UPF0149 family)